MKLVSGGLMAILASGLAIVSTRSNTPEPSSQPTATTTIAVQQLANRSISPAINGTVLPAPSGVRPPAPSGWAGSQRAIPTNNWWSQLTTGSGGPGVWAHPLAARISAAGRFEFGLPRRIDRPDGTFEGEAIPTVFTEFGSTPVVASSGALHATWRHSTPTGSVDITMSQGSPFIELEGTGTLSLVVPALKGLSIRNLATGTIAQTSTGPWVFAASNATATVVGDQFEIAWTGRGRLVAGPVPDGMGASVVAFAADVLARPLVDTTETLQLSEDGSVIQTLGLTRAGKSRPELWTLNAHQANTVVLKQSNTTKPSNTSKPNTTKQNTTKLKVGDAERVGSLVTARGVQPVVSASVLSFVFQPVPILWSPVSLNGNGFPVAPDSPPPLASVSRGSYFGGKAAATAALSSQLTADTTLRSQHLEHAKSILLDLVDPVATPQLAWEDQWGKAIIEPAEFGALDALNDHQLQNGYWVLAASILAEADPALVPKLRDAVELLIADYGGTGTPNTTVDPFGTWNPYEGHSWASGIGSFGAGNNLESISESSSAWWAAARWFIATGQPKRAERFISMLTIESHVTGDDWLPRRPPSDLSIRPWSGVVWAGKIDNSTWFDPAPESALGIRLLPLGPMSLSRYPDATSITAASGRWAWCEANGGCRTRWANLLDSDAAVAGRSGIEGPAPEESTTSAVSAWWRDLWTATALETDITCSAGVVARRSVESGGVVLLATNPSNASAAASCRNRQGRTVWSGVLAGHTTQAIRVP